MMMTLGISGGWWCCSTSQSTGVQLACIKVAERSCPETDLETCRSAAIGIKKARTKLRLRLTVAPNTAAGAHPISQHPSSTASSLKPVLFFQSFQHHPFPHPVP